MANSNDLFYNSRRQVAFLKNTCHEAFIIVFSVVSDADFQGESANKRNVSASKWAL